MFSVSSLLASVLIALSVSASPLVQVREPDRSVPFALRRSLNITSGSTIAEIDRQRAAQLISKGKALKGTNEDVKRFRRQSSFDVTNTAVTYVASVGVGSPATTYSLLIDTGSSNTWVGAGKAYVKTSTSHDTGDTFSVTYGSGSVSGEECTSSLA